MLFKLQTVGHGQSCEGVSQRPAPDPVHLVLSHVFEMGLCQSALNKKREQLGGLCVVVIVNIEMLLIVQNPLSKRGHVCADLWIDLFNFDFGVTDCNHWLKHQLFVKSAHKRV